MLYGVGPALTTTRDASRAAIGVTVLGLVGGAPARAGGETPRVADSSAAGACRADGVTATDGAPLRQAIPDETTGRVDYLPIRRRVVRLVFFDH